MTAALIEPDIAAWRKTDPPPDGYVTTAAFTGTITLRRLNFWVDAGYLQPADPHPGHGVNRLFPAGEVAIARAMVRLIDAGFTPALAATLAREAPGSHAIDLGVQVVTTGELWEPAW